MAQDPAAAHAEPEGPSDIQLITAVRGGDQAAFGVLYARHADAARRLARRLARRRADVDDLVSDAFARVAAALRRGGGPDLAFRPYLYTTLRRVAYDRTAAARREVIVDQDDFAASDDSTEPFIDPAVADLERSLTASAYRSLPERWQAVLWYTEVEGMSPTEVGTLLGLSANATAALSYRAREGLRQAYLQAHLATEPLRTCRPTVDRLAAYVRGGLSERDRAAVESHLDDCDRCRAAYVELADVQHGMRVFVAPLFLGAGAAGLVAKGGLVAWLWRVRPRSIPQAAAAGAATAAVVAAVALAVSLGGDGSPRPAASASSGPSSATTEAPTPTTIIATPPATTTPPVTTAAPPTTVSDTTAISSSPTATTVSVTTTDPPVTNATTIPTTTTLPPPPPDLAATISDVGALVAGREGIVSVGVVNRGAGPARDVVVEIDAPDGIDLSPAEAAALSTRATCSGVRPLQCAIGDIPSGADAAVFFRASPSSSGPVEFAVRVRSATPDLHPSDDTMSLSTEVHETGLSARWAGVGNLQVIAVGNSVATCPIAASGCAQARDRAGTDVRNNDWEMVTVDIDADNATVNSSAATLEIDGEVAFAGLYWGGDIEAVLAGTETNRVGLSARGERHLVDARRTDTIGTRYQSFADVTGIVRAAGSTRYVIDNVAMSTGRDQYGGWSLVVVIRSSAFPARTVAVFDGLLNVTPGTSARASLGGFSARAGAGAAIGLITYEGDATAVGDTVMLDGAALGDASNPNNDVMNSTVSSHGSAMGGRDPSDANTFGIDVDVLDASGRLAVGATRAALEFVTGGETYLVGAAVASVDR